MIENPNDLTRAFVDALDLDALDALDDETVAQLSSMFESDDAGSDE